MIKFSFTKIFEIIKGLKNYSLKEERRETYTDFFILITSLFFFLFLKINKIIKANDLVISILFYIFIFSLMDFIITFLRNIILFTYRKRNKINLDDENSDNLIIATYRVHKIIQVIIFIILLFTFLDIQITNFLTFLGVFFFGIVFLFKDFLLNFFYGLLLTFTNKIKIKDDIIFEDEYGAKNYRGKIRNIYFSTIELLLEDGTLFYISNSRFMNGRIINLTTAKKRRVEIIINLKIEKIEVFQKHIDKITKILEDREIVVKEIVYDIVKCESKTNEIKIQVFTSKDSFIQSRNEIKFLISNYFNSVK